MPNAPRPWRTRALEIGWIVLACVALVACGLEIDRVLLHDGAPQMPESVALGPAPTFGPNDAAVQVTIFSDFECPYCGSVARDILVPLRATYGARVRFVFYHFPITALHPHARGAAEHAVCAAEQGRFWIYHDQLFGALGSRALDPALIAAIDEAAHLDQAQLQRCLADGRARARVNADLMIGRARGVRATPTIFINDQAVVGAQPAELYHQMIDLALHHAADPPQH